MKTHIRFALAACFATLGCAGLLAQAGTIAIGFSVATLLCQGRAELTRPIPRRELWPTVAIIGAFIAVVITMPFVKMLSEGDSILKVLSHPEIVAAIWALWLWAIYKSWRREKGAADTHVRATSNETTC